MVSQGQPALVIMELMLNGDLKGFLRCHRPDSESFTDQSPLTLKRILRMAIEIADEATNNVVRKLEEKERLLQNSLATVEKELALRQQAMEMHKRKAIESAQSAADLKLHLEKYHSQMKEAQQVVAEKTSSLEAEAYKTKRLQVNKFNNSQKDVNINLQA